MRGKAKGVLGDEREQPQVGGQGALRGSMGGVEEPSGDGWGGTFGG